MSTKVKPLPTFNNEFNLLADDIGRLEIIENYSQDKCLIKEKDGQNDYYNSFILDENTKTRIHCMVSFYPSSKTKKYIPRLIFKKTDLKNEEKYIDNQKPINISFNKSNQSIVFWKFIGFLNSFKEIVDVGEFDHSYQVISKNAYYIEFENKNEKEKVEEIKHLIEKSDLKEKDFKNIVFEHRKGHIKLFYFLIKNKKYKGRKALNIYQEKYKLNGEEAVWHHFLKKNDWILGLNVDIKFIRDLFDEQKVGIENSAGKLSPKSDMLGISDYTSLIELKHSNTKIFKQNKSSKSRTDTWDFTSEFIEGVSQCLGQKFSLEKSFNLKEFTDKNGKRLDKVKHRTIDPKAIFIIGNRKVEFPHDDMEDHIIKSETFERFRRNNRNLEILTYDELFERSYHLVFSEKLNHDWFNKNDLF